MTDFENRARSAGTALRDWTPDAPATPAEAVAHRAVRRTRSHRAAAGTLLVAVLGGVGLLWQPGDGNDVEISPADTTEHTTPTTEAPTPSTTAESDLAPEGTTGTTTPTTAPTSTPTTTAAPEATAPNRCTGQFDGVTYEVTLPAGWHANGAGGLEPPCHYAGPDPVELSPVETESGTGVGSNAWVRFYLPHPVGQLPTSFEQSIADRQAGANTLDTRRSTIDGHPAVRYEQVTQAGDGSQGGERFVRWSVDLGDVWLEAVTLLPPGVTFDEAAAGIDRIMTGLQFPS